MKSTCVLPPLSDILNPHKYSPYSRPHPVLQVANLLTEQDYEDEPVKAKRKRASPTQLSVLNRVFEQTFFPSTELRIELGKQLGMSPRTVQIWFQNKRQSIRTRQRTTTTSHMVSPPISPSMPYYTKPDYISLPPLRTTVPTWPLTPSSSAQSSPNSSILFRDYY